MRDFGQCIIAGCPDKAVRKKSRLCNKHYQQWIYHKGQRPPKVDKKPKQVGCKIQGCPYRHFSNGFCNRHNTRWKNAGQPIQWDGGGPLVVPNCKLFGCTDEVYTHGYCRNHFQGWNRAGRPENWRPLSRAEHAKIKADWHKSRSGTELPTGCLIPGCKEPHYSNGYCARDYERWRHRGRPKGWLGT